jgi:hypothetical protein
MATLQATNAVKGWFWLISQQDLKPVRVAAVVKKMAKARTDPSEAKMLQPATSNQQPATSNQQPATSSQQPATSSQADSSATRL